MTRRKQGLGLVALGVLLVVAAVVAAMSGPGEGDLVASTASTSTTMDTRSTSEPTTTTSPDTTTTTTRPAPTTTVAPETVEEFVELFAAALAAGDLEFVMDRLHPDVVDGYTSEVCEAWVSSEIMALSDYGLTGDPTGPVDKTVNLAGQTATIADVYSAPVSFTFQGESFDSTADFALVNGVMRWLGSCQ